MSTSPSQHSGMSPLRLQHWRALPHLAVAEAAEVLGLGTTTVRALLRSGELEERRRCNRTFVTVGSILAWLGEQAPDGPPGAAPAAQPLLAADRQALRDLRRQVGS